MSWEEDIEAQLNRIESKLDQLLGGTDSKRTSKSRERKKEPTKGFEVIESVFRESKKPGIEWCFSDNNQTLADAVLENGGNLDHDGYSYWIYGDEDKFIGRREN